ncbi:hypothetical protein TNCV_1790051 [Trichonephila clavipes]|nr:hypothetical protein TNCV_1790051 [Trichonephila clavipes]
MKHRRYGLLKPKAHSCTIADCPTQSFTHHMVPVKTDIALLMTRNTLRCLISLIFNGIEGMDVYGYGDNLMNPWTLHVNRGLFVLVEAL